MSNRKLQAPSTARAALALSPELKDAVERIAFLEGLTFSQIARIALREYVGRRNAKRSRKRV